MRKKREIWSLILKDLHPKVSQSEWATWLSKIHLDHLDSDTALLRVPNKFVATWVSDHYAEEIASCFAKVLKKSLLIRFAYPQPSNSVLLQNAGPEEGHLSSPRVNLNTSMTFERFLKCESNEFAYSAAHRVADLPGEEYNPLYIFTPWGLGKTHLLHALGNHSLRGAQERRVKYLSAETFTSDFTYSSRTQRLPEFRETFRDIDLLLFDDVHLLSGRTRSQDELLSIYNTLFSFNKQIVITGDRAPSELRHISAQLRSRIGSGLIAEIRLPDQETRLNLVRTRLTEAHMDLSEDLVFFIAGAREDFKGLIKSIIRLQTFASLNDTPITISTARSLLRDRGKKPVTIVDIKNSITGYFNITLKDLTSGSKKRLYSYPRQLAMYLVKKHTGLSLKAIGEAFGHKDHSTVIYAVKQIQTNRDKVKSIDEDVRKLESLF